MSPPLPASNTSREFDWQSEPISAWTKVILTFVPNLGLTLHSQTRLVALKLFGKFGEVSSIEIEVLGF